MWVILYGPRLPGQHGRTGSPTQGKLKVLSGLELSVPVGVVVKMPSPPNWTGAGCQLETASSEFPRLEALQGRRETHSRGQRGLSGVSTGQWMG